MRPIVEIVSSPTPCGVTYLLNILVELEVLIYAGSLDVFWKFKGSEATPSSSLQRKFGQWIPSLTQDRFRFHDGDPAFSWSHDWPQRQKAGQKRILFVRDPRDAHFSQHQRSSSGETLKGFLQRPGPPLGLSRITRFCLQKSLWMELSDPDRFLVVRFEDLKQEPLVWVRKILQWAGLVRSDEAILEAIRKSSTEKVKEEHDRSVRETGLAEATGQIIRKGLPFEWKAAPGRADLALYSNGYTRHVLAKLGYEGGEPLRARESLDPVSKDLTRRWASDLYGAGDRYVLPDQRERLGAELELLLHACSPEERFRLGSWPSRSFSYAASRDLRMGTFCLGIRVADVLLNVSKRVLPPLERFLIRRLLSFPLGER